MKYNFRSFSKVLSVLLILSFFFGACQNESEIRRDQVLAGKDSVFTYSLNEAPELTLTTMEAIGDGPDSRVSSVKFFAAAENGWVYIYDDYRKKIDVFDANDTYEGTAGRTGNGPGEYIQVADIEIKNSELFVLDKTAMKVEVFNATTLNYLRSIRVPENQPDGGLPVSMEVLTNDSFLIGYSVMSDQTDRTIQYRLAGEEAGSSKGVVYEQTDQSLTTDNTGEVPMVFILPTEKSSFASSYAGKMIFAEGDQLIFTILDNSGNYERTLYFPVEPLAVNRTDVIEEYTNAKLRRAVRGEKLPEFWPVLDQLILDEKGNMWFSTITVDHTKRRWFKSDLQGNVAGYFDLDREFEAKDVRNDIMYSRIFDRYRNRDEIQRINVSLN